MRRLSKNTQVIFLVAALITVLASVPAWAGSPASRADCS